MPQVPESLAWKKEGLSYGDRNMGENSDSIFEHSTQFGISSAVQNNGSVYIHSFIVKAGLSTDPRYVSTCPVLILTAMCSVLVRFFSKNWTAYRTQRLNKFMKKSYKKTANLLTGQTEQSLEDQVPTFY